MDCSPPGFSVHGISQARILEWVAISFSRGSSPSRNQWCFSTFISTVFKSYRIASVSYHSEHLYFLILIQSHCCCCSVSRVHLFETPRIEACQASLSPIISQSLLKLKSIESMIPFNHLVLCHPLLLPSIFLRIRVFSNELALRIRWLKYRSISFSISPSNEYSGPISFRMDWLNLAVQGTLKNILQHHSSKASILQHSAFFIVQLSHPYMTTGKVLIFIILLVFSLLEMKLVIDFNYIFLAIKYHSKRFLNFNPIFHI